VHFPWINHGKWEVIEANQAINFVEGVLFFNWDQTLIDLMACNFPAIHPKLDVTLPNLTESNKVALDKNLRASAW
jgi:hypothetical protein